MDRESFPVGIFMPNSIEKFDAASTALYSLASSPMFLHGHIQFADSEIPLIFSFKGAQIILVSASAILFLLPAAGSIKPEIGECPIDVAIPLSPEKSNATTPQLFSGN